VGEREDKMADKKIKERVMQLLNKAADPAASEAEAAACLTKAKKLMDAHGLSEEEIKNATADDFREVHYDCRMSKRGPIIHPVDRYCSKAVGRFCGTVAYFHRDPDDSMCVIYFGLDSDTSLAEWMRASLMKQFDHDWQIYVNLQRKDKRLTSIPALRTAFAKGFAKAFNDRIDDWMYRASGNEDKTTDTALTFHKTDVVMQELANRGIVLGATIASAGRTAKVNAADAAGAGYNSGKTAAVGHAVHEGKPQLMLR